MQGMLEKRQAVCLVATGLSIKKRAEEAIPTRDSGCIYESDNSA